jgi:Amt family ammonium transporter
MESTALTALQYAFDTFYLLICGALVMWMAAGFAMLEAGLVRGKNTTEILTKNVALFAIACIVYLLIGYHIMYFSPKGGIVPSFGFLIGAENTPTAVLTGGEDNPYYAARADFFFQVVFAATSLSIVSGAVAERMKLWPFMAFAVLMSAIIYPVQGFWKWGGGFLNTAGFLDFAGSSAVHLTGASAALAGVILLGPRSGKYAADGKINAIPGANLPLATVGMFILWMGWFGFNGGSQLKMSTIEDANAVAQVIVNTNMAAAGGLMIALIVARMLFGKADLTMAINGALAGLVSITAEPLTPTALQATLIGGVGGALVVFAILGIDKVMIDDPVGAISVHGAAGIWGTLAVCLTNPESSLMVQLVGIACVFFWAFIVSLIIWGVIKMLWGLRVTQTEEFEGVDLVECGMEAYPEFGAKK